jgi:hypothetical protein
MFDEDSAARPGHGGKRLVEFEIELTCHRPRRSRLPLTQGTL